MRPLSADETAAGRKHPRPRPGETGRSYITRVRRFWLDVVAGYEAAAREGDALGFAPSLYRAAAAERTVKFYTQRLEALPDSR